MHAGPGVDAGYPMPVAEAWPGFDAARSGVRPDAAWLKVSSAEGVRVGTGFKCPPQPNRRLTLAEDAHATRANQQPDDDQQDAEQHLASNQGHDAADDEHHRDDPQDGCHVVPP